MEFIYKPEASTPGHRANIALLVIVGVQLLVSQLQSGLDHYGSTRTAYNVLMLMALVALIYLPPVLARGGLLCIDATGILIRYPCAWWKPDIVLTPHTLVAVEYSRDDGRVYLLTRDATYDLALSDWIAADAPSTDRTEVLLAEIRRVFPEATPTTRFDSGQYQKQFQLPRFPLLPAMAAITAGAVSLQTLLPHADRALMLPGALLFNCFLVAITLIVALAVLLAVHLRARDARYTARSGLIMPLSLGAATFLALSYTLPAYLLHHGPVRQVAYMLVSTDHNKQVWRTDSDELPDLTVSRRSEQVYRIEKTGSTHTFTLHQGFLDLRVIAQSDLDALKKEAD